ncbi:MULTISPECIES: hypothetical protein [unclassified Arthrobacter]|uniref:hypothetical protein n=1 Tax=unclassified Arthrobacter TaxID=235627 RepID=UPI001E553BD5|nr:MULTISPECIES: hypothetical protein [unclassified Arthrobacter]MCB5273703.1 hypothetical protein [Arthrobacter sp. SO5]MDI3214081.1 hypothetical protein [Arthrobacter sp. AL12]
MPAKKIKIVWGIVLALAAVFIIGYTTVQTQGMIQGYLVDVSGLPNIVIAKRFPWELQIAAVLFGLAGIAIYRKAIDTRPARIAVLAVFVLAAVIAAVFFVPVQSTRTNLFVIAFVGGGASSFNLALIAAVLADLIFEKGNTNGTTNGRPGHDREDHTVE